MFALSAVARVRPSGRKPRLMMPSPSRPAMMPGPSSSTVSLRSQFVLQPRHDVTRTMVIEPRLFVAAQPTGTAAALLAQFVDVQPCPNEPRDELPELRRRQCRGPDFSPAASPR